MRKSKLTDKDLVKIAKKNKIDFWDLKKSLPEAEAKLYKQLTDAIVSMNLD